MHVSWCGIHRRETLAYSRRAYLVKKGLVCSCEGIIAAFKLILRNLVSWQEGIPGKL